MTKPTKPTAVDGPTLDDAASPQVFSEKTFAWVEYTPLAVQYMSDSVDFCGDQNDQAQAAATTATQASGAALNSANATMWISGASYVQGQQTWSPIDFLTYRSKTTHSGETTDPSLDSTNWRETVGDGYAPKDSPEFVGEPTAPTPDADDNSTKIATTAYVDGNARKPAISSVIVDSAVSEVVLELDGYTAYELVMVGVVPDGIASLFIQFGSANDTFFGGAADYQWRSISNVTLTSDDDDTDIRAFTSVDPSASGAGANLTCQIYPSPDGTKQTHISGDGCVFGSGAVGHKKVSFSGHLVRASSSVSHIKIKPAGSAEFTSGEFHLYPLAG